MRCIEPMRKCLEHELQMRVDPSIRLTADNYALDLVGRSQALAKLIASGVDLDEAMSIVGLEE